MVTLTLIQGVVNTFVVFLARVVGYFVDKVLLRGNSNSGPGIGYMATVFVCELLFGLLASIIVAWFSRQREFRADAGSAKLLGSPVPMRRALMRLGGMAPGALPSSMAAFGIAGGARAFGALFSTHPPMEQRIAALNNLR
jgi:heat shock protein HtpX